MTQSYFEVAVWLPLWMEQVSFRLENINLKRKVHSIIVGLDELHSTRLSSGQEGLVQHKDICS